jgi:hypothetical protein
MPLQGGASILMKAVLNAHCSDKHIYACDSYQGLPGLTDKDKSLAEERAQPMDKQGEVGANMQCAAHSGPCRTVIVVLYFLGQPLARLEATCIECSG